MSSLADYLEKQAESLVGFWNERLLEDDGDSKSPRSDLIEHLPELIGEAVRALRAPTEAARERARRQHRLGFDLGSLVREHGVFRSVVLGRAENEGIVVTPAELRIFVDVMADALAHAVVQHTQHVNERLRETEAQWRRVVDALPVLVARVGPDGHYELVNLAYEAWFGRSRDEITGQIPEQLVGPETYAVLGPFVERALAGESFSCEVRGVPYPLGTRDVKVTFVAKRDPRGEPAGYISLLDDVTAQRTLEAERDRLAEERVEVLAAQREFERQLIGIVSHDLRNPLNLISMASHMLTRQGELDERRTKIVSQIKNATESAARLVRDLLDFTQARLGGGLSIDPRPGDLNELVQAVLEELEVTYPSRQVQLVRHGDASGEFDADRITQMLHNLVTNAVKYSPEASIVKVVTRGDGDHVVLRVCNEGIPIPADKLPVIFESFERAAGALDRTGRSVGLGLYIVRHIATAHQGTIEVESNLEEGTVFTVRLPRAGA